MYNKFDGTVHPSWQSDPVQLTGENVLYSDVVAGPNEEVIVFTDREQLYALDIPTGTVKWTYGYFPQLGLTVTTRLGEDIIQSYSSWGAPNHWSSIGQFDYQTGQLRELVKIKDFSGFDIQINAPTFKITPSGDTLIYFATNGWNYSSNSGRVEVYAYNLTQEKHMWKAEDIFDNVHSMTNYPLVVEEGKVILPTGFSIHCLNADDGSIEWEHSFTQASEGFTLVPFKYYNGKLISQSTASTFRAYDIHTGQLQWKASKDYYHENGMFDIYNDKIYFTGTYTLEDESLSPSSLICLDLHTGNQLWSEDNFANGVCIDQNTGYLYTSRSSTVLCIDLNNPPSN